MFGRMKIGILGTGTIAGVMARTIQHTRGVTLYAVGSRTLEKAQTFGREYGVKNCYGSYLELVRDPKVEAIYVASPHSEHFEHVCLAVEHGKHVLCEKAFMLNEAQARRVFELAAEKKVFVGEAMWTRFMPFNDTIRRVISGGMIGDPTMLTANLGYPISSVPRLQDPALGGGALLDLGVYCLNFASMVFGDDVVEIAARADKNELGVDLQDSITLRYRSGRLAVLSCTAKSVCDNKAAIFGTRGRIEITNINNYEDMTVYDAEGRKLGAYKRPRQITGYEYELLGMVSAIREGWYECAEMPHAQTLRMMNMMDFIRKQIGVSYPGELDGPGAAEAAADAAEDAGMQALEEQHPFGELTLQLQEQAEPVELVAPVEPVESADATEPEEPAETTEEAKPADPMIENCIHV